MNIKIFLMIIMFFAVSFCLQSKTIISHTIALHGSSKYPANFKSFEYVNPNAPKGGTLTLSDIGTYDSFNRYALRGNTPSGIEEIYDTLIISSEDEAQVYYCLIADKIEYSDDNKWIIYHINPKATFQDGKPITADDVVFTYNKFFNEGVPQFKLSYKDNVISVEALDKSKVKFTLKAGDKEMLISLGELKILPKIYWENKKLGEPLLEPPLGSGAYKVKEYKMGEFVIYERMKNYWALEIPVNKGRLNFDFVRYDFYRDLTIAFEAFKAGEFDYWSENSAKNWATMYTGSQFDSGNTVKEEIKHEIPQMTQALVFNITRPVFSDRKVRMALNYALDFEWMNKNLFYGQYTRTRSYFPNTKFEAKGLPSADELKILNLYKGKIPDEIFTKEYMPPVSDGSGNIRNNIQEALKLLKEAGWEIKDQKLVDKNGKQMAFEILIPDQSYERIVLPVKNNLEKFGILMNIRNLDSTQFLNRLRNRDFDMISSSYYPYFYPDSNLKITWRSNFIDSTYNTAGVKNEVVDALIDKILDNLDNESLVTEYMHALDRLLTYNYYIIPEWYLSKFRISYWNKFSRPNIRPKYALGIDTWWVDKDKESKLPKRNIKK